MIYFLINHDTGVVESAETLELAIRLIQEWLTYGTDEEDVSLFEGSRRTFETKIIKQVSVNY